MMYRENAIREAEEYAKALTEHECAGPPTVFINADGRKVIQVQCVACLRRIGGALKQPHRSFGTALGEPGGDWLASLSLNELVERHRRLAAYAQLLEGIWSRYTFKPKGDTDPLSVYSEHVRRDRYNERLRRPDWQLLRKRIIERAHGQCELCGVSGSLDVHHLNYARFGKELPEDLAAVCRVCHSNKLHHH
jgi:hypothetical protein